MMKKRITALALALAMLLGSGAASADDGTGAAETPAAEAASTETEGTSAEAEAPKPEPDAEGTLSFGNLGARMKENYLPLLALNESIIDIESHDYEWRYENLRTSLNYIVHSYEDTAKAANNGVDVPGSGLMAWTDSNYVQALNAFDKLKDGTTVKDDQDLLWKYRNTQELSVVAGETLYMQIKAMQAQDEEISRSLAKLDRVLQETELRRELGQVSELSLTQLKNQRTQIASGQQTLRMGIETMLLTLKNMVGAELDKPLSLGALPEVTAEQLAAMDLEADLEKARAVSYELYDAKKQVEDYRKGPYASEVYSGKSDKFFEVSQVKHALEAMKLRQQQTEQNYELNFRTLYAQVKDAAQVLDAKRVAVESQEMSYAAAALKFEQGSISANALADAADELAAAKDAVANAERDLFSKYRSYCWAVEYGILNG